MCVSWKETKWLLDIQYKLASNINGTIRGGKKVEREERDFGFHFQ